MLMGLPLTLGLICADLAHAMRDVKPGFRNRVLWFSSPDASRLILLGLAAMMMALSLVLTMSRSGISALALALLITGAFVMRRQQGRGRRAAGAAYLLLLAIVVVGWVGADRIAHRFAQADWAELNKRRGAWADALSIAGRFPLAGTGLNTYATTMLLYQQHDLKWHYEQAHNDYLQLLAEGGLLVGVPVVAALGAFAVLVRRRFRDETSTTSYWIRAGAATGLVAIALQETVEFTLQMPGNAALFAVLCGIALHPTPARARSAQVLRYLR
jgi:O-antigen ligase